MSAVTIHYKVEYSKTDRSSCKKCKGAIPKDSCRIAKNSPSPFHDGFVTSWFHVQCFFIKEKGKLVSSQDLKGFTDLRIDDQVKISNLIAKDSPTGGKPSAASAPSQSASNAANLNPNDEMTILAAENNKKFWEMKDRIEKEEIPNKMLKALLELNNMPGAGGRPDLVSRVADALLFGVATCPVCQQRDMWWSTGQYFCKAEANFGLCAYKGLPKTNGGRVEVVSIKTDHSISSDWMRNWKQPLLPREKMTVVRDAVAEYQRDAGQPLRGMKFTSIGFLERSHDVLQKLIQDNGGSYVNDIQADVDYVLTTYEDIIRTTQINSFSKESQSTDENNQGLTKSRSNKTEIDQKKMENLALRKQIGERLKQAMDLNLALVTEPLLDRLMTTFGFDQTVYLLGGSLPPIAFAKLATPASVFPTKNDVEQAKDVSSISTETQAQPEPPKFAYNVKKSANPPVVKVAPRGTVDDDAGCPNGKIYRDVIKLEKPKTEAKQEPSSAIVFESMKDEPTEEENIITDIYDRMLSWADVTVGLNKFYRLQLIDIDGNGSSFTLFTKWGRIGEPGNSTKTTPAGLKLTLAHWAKKWEEKTGNKWNPREEFVKKPGKYSPVDMEEPEAEAPIPEADPDAVAIPSYLDLRLKSLIDMIFDPKMLEKSMLELKIDVKKMPLGRLRRDTLINGYAVLKEIEDVLLSTDDTQKFKLPQLSSQFYTLVAHDFGRRAPEIIDNFGLLKLKMKQLETLLDILVAAQLLMEAPPLVQTNPSDLNYQKLHVNLIPLSNYTREYKMVQRYVNTGYNPKTLGSKIRLVDVFKVDRPGEADNFYPFKEQRPRKLLWHGSRICNFVGILNSGLRIAPPEAPASGYMFGKAIYLSDLIEKSAPYCCPDPESKQGLLLLCDTALGEALELNRPEYITQLPEGKSSAKALARFQPDPSKEETAEEKVIVPIGAPTPTNLPDVFLDHAEYMVYDAAQIRIKYLVRVEFDSTNLVAK